MDDNHIADIPKAYPAILEQSKALGFSMPSDLLVGSLLKTLVAAKPGGRFLEMGTGTGLALSWMVAGMDKQASVISLDHDPDVLAVAEAHLGSDPRVEWVCSDGSTWIQAYSGPPFDLIFADTWAGKYTDLDQTLDLLVPGGIYLIDDMAPQPNWPLGHAEKAEALIAYLDARKDLALTKMNWSTGVILGVKLP